MVVATSPKPKTIQKRRNTLVRQVQIVDAARRLIVRYGSEHLTVRRIAKEIGVSEGALYRHFKSKRDILLLLVEHIKDNLISDIERGRHDGYSPLETLDGALRNHVSAMQQRKGISFQVIAEIISLGDKKLNRKAYDVINNYTDRIRGMLGEGVKSGEIRQDIDLEAAATVLFGMIQGLVNTWALSDYSLNLEQRYESAWSIFRSAVVEQKKQNLQ